MALPILETATYELSLPSSGVLVKFRPFLVKEEKLLLMALESEDNKQITNALKDIVRTCTFDVISVESMPTFDLEYIFLNIRAKSVGEIAKLKILCPDDNETYTSIELDLSTVDVQVDDAHSTEIVVNDKVRLIMQYPTIDSFDPSTDANKLQTNQLFDIIAGSVAQIVDGEEIHQAKDYSKEEMNSFIDTLSSEAFNKIQNFFNTMPKLMHEVEVENPKTKVKSKVKLQGLASFFVSPSHMTT